MAILKSTATLCGLALVGVLILDAPDAHAYQYFDCAGDPVKWTSSSATVRYPPVSFPVGAWQNALTETINRWNSGPANFSLALQQQGDNNVGFDNGENEVWFSADSAHNPAVRYWWITCLDFGFFKIARIDETDVVFWSGVAYTPSTTATDLWPYGGGSRPFQTTAMHEFGHALGLLHVNTEYNIMGSDWTHIHRNGNTARAYPGEDAADGAVFLYGLRSPLRQDLAVTHWKYLGSSGQYSTHQRSQLYTTTGAVLPSFTSAGEPTYQVNRGQVVRTEFTYENNGASFQSGIDVGYYLSTNNLITTVDRRIGGASFSLGRADVYNGFINVAIPNDVNSGQTYWLGVIIDEDDSLSEAEEWNNATYTPIRIN